MSGRGFVRGSNNGLRNQGRYTGRGRGSTITPKVDKDSKFEGGGADLPILDFGGAPKDNKPIEFLQLMGEYVALHYSKQICQAFWSTPPAFGADVLAPVLPDVIPNTNVGKALLAEYTNDHKEWKADLKKYEEHKMVVYSLVYTQLSESSRVELKEDLQWLELSNARDLLYLIRRIRATHIARQSGNPGMDKERVRMVWANMRMQSNENSYEFRKRVENHQLQRSSVGLPIIPESELVIGILNKLDMSRYAQLTKDYFDNERRGIAVLPPLSGTLWREIKDSQIIRYRGTAVNELQGVYLSNIEDLPKDYGSRNNRGGRGGRGGRGSFGGRGGGRGRGQVSKESNVSQSATVPMKSSAETSLVPRDIICWTCGKKGHRSTICPMKKIQKSVHFTSAVEEAVFLTAISKFNPRDDDCVPDTISITTPVESISVVTTGNVWGDTVIMLDTQASVHIISSSTIASQIMDTEVPVMIQGITGDRVRVQKQATIKGLNITGYYSPEMAANIISYYKLKDTHDVNYDDQLDTFTATPYAGPTLTFVPVNGHYIMDLATTVQTFMVNVKTLRYSARQLTTARKAYDFLIRMGYLSYKSAAEIVQRGSMKGLDFTRADLVIAQDVFGIPAPYIMGQGTQSNKKCQDNDLIPIHESTSQDLQLDLFYFLGQVFLLSISILMGLIMVTHLGPGKNGDVNDLKSRKKAGKALLVHLHEYEMKGFNIRSVTSDNEGAIKAVKSSVNELGIDFSVQGHGTHMPHAESAIRHVKNKARAVLYGLQFPLPSKLAAALITYVVTIVNMVPKINSPGHLPAFTAFKGRVPNLSVDAPFPFCTTGILQRASGPSYNSSMSRGDYCIWLGTTRNLKGTHKCLNLDTFKEITGDVFRPTPLTDTAIQRMRLMSGPISTYQEEFADDLLVNPNPSYALDPTRGMNMSEENMSNELLQTDESNTDIVQADDLNTEIQTNEISSELNTIEMNVELNIETVPDNDVEMLPTEIDIIQDEQVFSAMTVKNASNVYGDDVVSAAVKVELIHLIGKKVFECLPPSYVSTISIPSKMFITEKKLPSGEFDKLKARLVAGGHKQDRSLYTDESTSSPTVAFFHL